VNRGSRWGNPFYLWPQNRSATVFGQPWGRLTFLDAMPTCVSAYMVDDVAYASFSSPEDAVAHAVDLFRTYCKVRQRDIPEQFAAWLNPLIGKNLACYCRLDSPCHADVLLELCQGVVSG
jgi:hypothetical protein